MLLGASRGGNPLERIVGVPRTETGPYAAHHKKELGVLRPSGGANAVAGCWATNLPQAGFWPTSCWHTTDPPSLIVLQSTSGGILPGLLSERMDREPRAQSK